jgi:Protein of unknown function with HXXEE motif
MPTWALATTFVIAVVLHNSEEAAFLPAWSAHAGRWHPKVEPAEFRFAVGVLTVLLAGLAVLAFGAGPRSAVAYVFFGYVFAMAANAVVPHALASVVLGKYMPGTATGVLLNLPLGAALLVRAVSEGWVGITGMVVAGPVVAIALVVAIPGLFKAGRQVFRASGRADA